MARRKTSFSKTVQSLSSGEKYHILSQICSLHVSYFERGARFPRKTLLHLQIQFMPFTRDIESLIHKRPDTKYVLKTEN